mgnify:FL=1
MWTSPSLSYLTLPLALSICLSVCLRSYMDGWDDPRMPTIKGLRRRGYTAEILNGFCNEIGATRNANTVSSSLISAQHSTAQHFH